jgi:hypothetical protein
MNTRRAVFGALFFLAGLSPDHGFTPELPKSRVGRCQEIEIGDANATNYKGVAVDSRRWLAAAHIRFHCDTFQA